MILKTFAIFDGKLNWCPDNLTPMDWLVGSGLFNEEVFYDLVRGDVTDTYVSFYTGIDMKADDYTKEMSLAFFKDIPETDYLPVVCGLTTDKKSGFKIPEYYYDTCVWKPVADGNYYIVSLIEDYELVLKSSCLFLPGVIPISFDTFSLLIYCMQETSYEILSALTKSIGTSMYKTDDLTEVWL